MKNLKSVAIWGVVVLAVVAAFFWSSENSKKSNTESERRQQAHIEKVERLLSTTKFDAKVFESEHGQMLVVEIPLKAEYGGAEKKRCMVWRDAATKTASISCDPVAQDIY